MMHMGEQQNKTNTPKAYKVITTYLKIWRKSEHKGLSSAIKAITHFKWFRC